MAESVTAIPLSKIEPLNEQNYNVWALKLKAVLRSRQLYDEVIKLENEPENGEANTPQAKVYQTWKRKNDEAFSIIIVTLSDEIAGQFEDKIKAKEVWDALHDIYAGNIEDRRIDKSIELKNVRMQEGETVDSYLTRTRHLASQCATLGQTVPTREVVYHAVRGLSPKYERIGMVLRAQRGITMEELRQTLKEEESRLNEKVNMQRGSERAYRVTGNWRNRGNIVNNKRCYICNHPNHLERDCWFAPKNNDRPNHSSRANERQNSNRERYTAPSSNGNRQRHSGRPTHHSNGKKRPEHALTTSIVDRTEKNVMLWNLDSGCTAHMTPHLELMSDVVPHRAQVQVAESGREIEAEARGRIRVTTELKNGSSVDLCIEDVLYVPKLRGNLLSVKSLVEKGNSVTFEKNATRIISNDGTVLAEPNEEENTYIIETRPRDMFDETDDNDDDACLNATHEDGNGKQQNSQKRLWHRRMGHLNEEYLERMMRQNMVRGLEFEAVKLDTCEECVLGKLPQRSFKRVEGESAKSPLDLVHMDLCGPLPVDSLGGNRYIYILVDSYSRYIFVYFLKAKSEAFEAFVEFVNKVETERGRKIKRVRSDNGGEFVNKKFDEYFRSKGIHHEKTVPHCPSSNGVAERANRSILDKSRTMLIDADLPSCFWAEAVMTAVHLKNRSPTTDGDVTPIERWSGRKPTVEYLKTFGCVAYYHVSKIMRNKLDPRAKKGIFLGYASNRKAYRILNPDDMTVTETNTVTFNEKLKGSTLLTRENEQCDDFDLVSYVISEDEVTTSANINDCNDSDGNGEEVITTSQESTNPSREREDQAPNRPGRKPGDTNELIEARHQIQLQEREQRLRESGVRRSERIAARSQEDANEASEIVKVPKTFEEAMSDENADEWIDAMHEELESLNQHQVWELVPREEANKVLRNRWVYSRKRNEDGMTERFKARLVAVGCGQRPGEDYTEAFAPVLKMETFRLVIALAAQLNLKIQQYDIKTAYLYGELKEDIYMEQPVGFSDNDKFVCKLKKSVYGLPQSGHNWNVKLNEVLLSLGLQRSKNDPCLYFLQEGDEMLLFAVYVDDILAVGTSNEIISRIVNQLKLKFQMHEVKAPYVFLGIEISSKDGEIVLSQGKQIQKILERFKMENCNAVGTPNDPGLKLEEFEDSPKIERKQFLEQLGSLMYISTGTRPDITHNVNRLSQFSKDPRKIHLIALKKIYRYLKGTANYGLSFKRKDETTPQIEISTDASWSVTKDSRSFSGYVVKFGDSIISWRSKKQDLVTLSTCESELVAICEGVREINWLSSLLEEIGQDRFIAPPVCLKTDSKSAMQWISRDGVSSRTKHIQRRFHFVKDEVRNGNIELRHVSGQDIEADILTKGVGATKMRDSVRRLLGLKIIE